MQAGLIFKIHYKNIVGSPCLRFGVRFPKRKSVFKGFFSSSENFAQTNIKEKVFQSLSINN